MIADLNSNWKKVLKDELQKPYFVALNTVLEEEYQTHTCYPPAELIFSAFNSCDFADLKVVIIGQDPYHGEGEANGLCFSVNDCVKIPPSLRNIYKEIHSDLEAVFIPESGNLKHWAQQGVLLLNASLTVQKDSANSHKHLKWNLFTDAVIKTISEQKEGVVFLLWGAFAHKKGAKINRNKHLVLESGHPSPMSANQGKWFGNKHFSQTNAFLLSKNKSEINWF
ncbi:uracil-DNA glycosylase [Flavobacterium sp. TMP13]|uniref:uracil-DNA glycosylase n=1 Tax=Flavobacterium sp. TMP13 TaxID=3425950 RepID=UPI003D77838A